jgi:hypothetical protein
MSSEYVHPLDSPPHGKQPVVIPEPQPAHERWPESNHYDPYDDWEFLCVVEQERLEISQE